MPAGGVKRLGQAAQTDSDVQGDGLRREHVSEIQRARILAATFEVCAKRGASGLTVAPIVACAGVSRRTFYELFSGVEECLLAALDDGIARLAARVTPAWQQEGKWRERMRGALIELLAFLDNDPVTGRLLVVDTLGAGHKALERRRNVLAQVIAAVDEGRGEGKEGRAPPPLTGEGVVGAVASIIYGRMLTRLPPVMGGPRTGEARDQPLIELTGPLMSMIVLPYLGPAAARKELERPAPASSDDRPAMVESPLRDLPMRLTYRTLRVLSAIAGEPGASNRAVGNAAGIDDQGQISKLLKRLEKLGLIHNGNSHAPLRGAANSWSLTGRGEQVTRSLRVPSGRG